MQDQETDHNLIEHILYLLDIPQDQDAAMASSPLSETQKIPPLLDTPDMQITHEVIRFMDEMPGGFLIYHADEDERIIYANQALLRIFQCDTFQELMRLAKGTFRGLVHPEDLENVEKSIQKQVSSSKYDLDYVEYRIIRKDNTVRWVENYGHFIHSKMIDDIFYVFIIDVTARKSRHMAERAAYDQEYVRRLEVIEGLSANYESILYADLDADTIHPYRLSNRTDRQFEQRFQVRSFSWYVSDYANTWVHPDDYDLLSTSTDPAYIRTKLSNCSTYYVNYRVIYEGELQYIQLRIVNVGNPKHVSQIVMGYRRVDEEVQREMKQKQILQESLKKANLAIVAKNTFLSNMSHDMRTPLNAIFGSLALSRQNHDQSALLNYLDQIELSARQLLDQINKTLEIAWTESNDRQLNESKCNLRELLLEVHNSLFSQAAEKNITFSFDDSSLSHRDVYADYDKLTQLLHYLTDNAITYTNPGGKITITALELQKTSSGQGLYQFSVKDNGIGISKDFLPRIFEPFEREKNTTFSGIHGTGLGLTIAKNITEMMGGTIEVFSELGKGSIFTITLYLQIQAHPLTHPVKPEDVIPLLQGRKILLVEDNLINREIETKLLQEIGFSIETAEDGNIAVEKVKKSKHGEYALILMDIQMPVMDGREATRNIRNLRDPVLSRLPIIALSADAFESDKQKSIDSGMDAHLAKPLNIPQLLEAMAKVVHEHIVMYGDF